MKVLEYNRAKPVNYAKKWAYARNPKYYNFDEIGGDCTNFVSQCILDGCNVMNYTKTFGWYYIDLNNRSPSWTGARFLYDFLVRNKDYGPFGIEVQQRNIMIGDIVQFKFDKEYFSHSAIVVSLKDSNIFVSTHTFDTFNKHILEYNYTDIRFIHIQNYRK